MFALWPVCQNLVLYLGMNVKTAGVVLEELFWCVAAEKEHVPPPVHRPVECLLALSTPAPVPDWPV